MADTRKKKKRNTEGVEGVGKKIRYYRELKGLSRKRLGELTGLEEKGIYNYEYGKVDTNITTLLLLAEHLEVNAGKFFED